MKFFTAKKLAFLSLFTALIMLTTMFVKVPNPLMGYTNFGDTFIFLAAALFGPLFALISGAIGSALADILLGFTAYAPFTLLIKGVEGMLAGILARALIKAKINRHVSFILGCIIGAIEMIAGYFLTNSILAGSILSGVGGILNDCLQGGLSVVFAYILTLALSRITAMNSLADNILNKPLDKGEHTDENRTD